MLPALVAGAAHRLRARLRPRGRRIRLGHLHRRQHADVSEIAPLLIVIKLEEFDYAGAAAIAAVMLVVFAAAAARSTRCSAGPTRAGSGHDRHERSADDARALIAGHAAPRDSCAAGRLVAVDRRSCADFCAAAGRRVRRGLRARAWRPISPRLRDPDALAAIRLTLLVAAIAVPLNARLRGRRRLGDRQVRVPRQERC